MYQTLILGCHRSGTSLLTRLVNLVGYHTFSAGQHIGANKQNPYGFWERSDVIEINDSILARCTGDWRRVAVPFDADLLSLCDPDVTERIRRVLLDVDSNRPWVIKDPRLCITAAVWLRELDIPRLLFICREPEGVAASLKKAHALPVPLALAIWVFYNLRALDLIAEFPNDSFYIGFDELTTADVSTLELLYGFLTHQRAPSFARFQEGAVPHIAKLSSNSEKSEQSISTAVPELVTECFRQIKSSRGCSVDEKLRAEALSWAREMTAAIGPTLPPVQKPLVKSLLDRVARLEARIARIEAGAGNQNITGHEA